MIVLGMFGPGANPSSALIRDELLLIEEVKMFL